MTETVNSVSEFFSSGIGAALKAILLLLIAFLVAYIAKNLMIRLLSKTKLAETKSIADKDKSPNVIELIAKFVQLVVFLLFVPGIFEILGMTQVSTPIITMLQTIVGYVPNVIGAIVILWIGFYAAKLVRELLIPVFNKLQVNKLQNMAGIEVSDSGKLSNTLAYIVYVLIIIPVIITALYVLNIRVITDPAIAMLGVIFQYIPNILAALIIIMIGWVLAKFIGNIVTRLIAASGLDAKLASLMDTGSNSNFVLSSVAGKTVEVILVIFFVVESFSALHLGVLTHIGVAIINYLPNALAAFIIGIIAIMIASILAKSFKNHGKPAAAEIARTLVYVIGVFLILNQLGIARTLVDSAFIIILLAVAIAFAISFGIGGRQFAKNCLALLQEKLNIHNVPDNK